MRPPRGRGFGGRDGGRGGRDGGRGGGRGFGGRGGGRGGGGYGYDQGPPESVTEAGTFSHPCEGEAVCKLTNEKVRPAVLLGRRRGGGCTGLLVRLGGGGAARAAGDLHAPAAGPRVYAQPSWPSVVVLRRLRH